MDLLLYFNVTWNRWPVTKRLLLHRNDCILYVITSIILDVTQLKSTSPTYNEHDINLPNAMMNLSEYFFLDPAA